MALTKTANNDPKALSNLSIDEIKTVAADSLTVVPTDLVLVIRSGRLYTCTVANILAAT